jgi:immune inhibitor A
MRRLFLSIICLATAICTYAVKAWPFPVDMRQSDGTTITVVMHGDEDFSYYTTLDGVLLARQDNDFYVATINSEGELISTGQLAHNAELRTAAERKLANDQNRSLFLQTGQAEANRRKMRREPVITTKTSFPHEGTPKAVVILAEFKDTTFTIENPKLSFHEYFNSLSKLEDHGRGESANTCSIAKYFEEVSFGKYVPQFDVYGPVKLPSALKTYGGTKADGKDEKMDLLFQDACALMDDSLDFSQYDANNDGNVDLVIVVYAGYSQSMTGNSNDCIWPKAGTTSGGKYDGKNVSRYAVNAELNGFPGCWSKAPFKRINGIGTMCHEFCHTLGLPDFYPTVASVKGNNQGMEYWSLMDSGNYISNGYHPVALNAWEREAFGWMEIPTLTESADLEIKSIDAGGTAYRIANDNDVEGHEYFVIENIQNIRLNQGQKGHGLIVYHVDYDKNAFSLTSNNVNNQKGHPRMTVVPADGLLFAQYNIGKTIDGKEISTADFYTQLAGDPFPGTSGVTELNDTTGTVNFQVYNGEKLNKALSGITENDGVINLRFISDFTSGITHTLTSSALPSDDSIYTLDGRKVGNNPEVLPRGIYITRGKKIIR